MLWEEGWKGVKLDNNFHQGVLVSFGVCEEGGGKGLGGLLDCWKGVKNIVCGVWGGVLFCLFACFGEGLLV